MRAKKIVIQSSDFPVAVPARTVTKKALCLCAVILTIETVTEL